MTKRLLVVGIFGFTMMACSKAKFHESEAGRGKGGDLTAKNQSVGLSAEERGRWLAGFGLQDLLHFAVLETASVATDLSRGERAIAASVLADLDECGLENMGPACLDGIETLDLNLVNDGYTSTLTAHVRAANDQIVDLAFSYDEVSLKQNILNLTAKLMDGPESVLFTGTVSIDFVPRAWARLLKPRMVRELYHMSRGLLTLMPDQAGPRLAQVFASHVPLMVAPGRENYEFETLKMAVTELPVDKAAMVAMGEELLHSDSEDVDQLAAIAILKADPTRTSPRLLVTGALSNDLPLLRRLGEEVLGGAVNLGDDHKALLLKGARDADPAVRATSARVVENQNFNSLQRADIMALAQHTDPAIRQLGLRVFVKMKDVRTIARMVGDNDATVRASALAALSPKDLSSSIIEILNQQAQSNPDAGTRVGVTELLAKSDAPEAQAHAIARLGDADPQVRAVARAFVERQPVSNQLIAPLTALIDSKDANVQKDAVAQMKRIRGTQASVALIQHLNTANPEIREMIFKQLSERAPTADLIDDLKVMLDDANADVKAKATQLLARIHHPEACLAIKQPCGGPVHK